MFRLSVLSTRLRSRALQSSNTLAQSKLFYPRAVSSIRYFSTPVETKNDDKLTGKDKRPKVHFKTLISMAKPEAPLILGGLASLLVAASISMYVPTAFGTIIDLITQSSSDPNAAIEAKEYTMKITGLVLLGAVGTFGRVICFNVAGERLITRIRKQLFSSITKQDISFFDHTQTGELVNRLMSDTVVMSRSLSGTTLSQGVRGVAQTSFCLGFMYYLSPALTTTVFLLTPILAGSGFIYGKFVKKLTKQVQDALALTTQISQEKISNIRLVRSFGKEIQENNKYNDSANNVYKLAVKEAKASATFFSIVTFTGTAAMIAVLSSPASMALTPGVLTSFMMYTVYLAVSVSNLASFYSETQKGLGASERIIQLLNQESTIPLHNGIQLQSLAGDVEFNNIQFAYPTRPDINVLNNFSLTLKEGKCVAVVGSSGSGKSTIASLLLRFYDPNNGEILIDKKNIKSLNATSLRSHIGVVSQNCFLFAGTLADNISYAKPDATMEDIIKCAKEANAHDFIMKLPDGYDTLVGENGLQLSGGQRQRVAIARALIINPSLLILDEATSSLDNESESVVQEAIDRVMHKRTTLVIAHRLTTVRNADEIVVLDHGSIVENGTHNELMKNDKGFYYRLVHLHTDNSL